MAMRSGAIPFKFDMAKLCAWAQRQAHRRLADATVTLNLPYLGSIGGIRVAPKDREREVARELVIRLKDRRVLSASECCDDCIDRALGSLQEIRQLLVAKQVELSDLSDGPLFQLMDAMVVGIRQFLTFEQRLSSADDSPRPARTRQVRSADTREIYFDALEVLRGHLSRCLGQVAVLAGMDHPSEGLIANYKGPWPLDAYVQPTLPSEHP